MERGQQHPQTRPGTAQSRQATGNHHRAPRPHEPNQSHGRDAHRALAVALARMAHDPLADLTAYCGGWDIHDGYIRNVERTNDKVAVTIESPAGRHGSDPLHGPTSQAGPVSVAKQFAVGAAAGFSTSAAASTIPQGSWLTAWPAPGKVNRWLLLRVLAVSSALDGGVLGSNRPERIKVGIALLTACCSGVGTAGTPHCLQIPKISSWLNIWCN